MNAEAAQEKCCSLRLDVIELNRLLEFTNNVRVKNILKENIQKLEQEISNLRAVNELVDGVSGSVRKKVYDVKLTTYAWDQNNTTVTIFVTLKDVHNVPKETIVCNFGNRLADLVVKEFDGKNYLFTINNLAEDIIPEKCSFKTKKDLVVLILPKKTSGDWTGLTLIEKQQKVKRNQSLAPDLENSNEDPSAGLMQMMQRIYEDGDDEMKRTISKAWTESMNKRGHDF